MQPSFLLYSQLEGKHKLQYYSIFPSVANFTVVCEPENNFLHKYSQEESHLDPPIMVYEGKLFGSSATTV